jgi:hypothetical protein
MYQEEQTTAGAPAHGNGSPLPPWQVQTLVKLEGLRCLPRGWDSHDGLPLQPEAAAAVEGLLRELRDLDLPVPGVVLGPEGTVQLEWRRDGRELELEVQAPGVIHSLRVFVDGRMEEGNLGPDLGSEARRLSRWLLEG